MENKVISTEIDGIPQEDYGRPTSQTCYSRNITIRKNPVISTEYVKRNFIHKDKIREIYNNNEFMTVTERIEFYQRELRKILEETEDENNIERSTSN